MPMMWDRLRTAAPHERMVEERMLGGHSTSTKGYSYSIKGGPPPPRPPREFLESQYETAPPVREPQPPPRNPKRLAPRTSNNPNSAHPHRQPSIAHNHSAKLASEHGRRYGGGEEISPPSSPEPGFGGATDIHGGDVSPIDEEAPDLSQHGLGSSRPLKTNQPERYETDSPPQNRAATNIPMMRRARRKQSDAALREANTQGNQRPSSRQQIQRSHVPRQEDPRWDPLTGERTSSPHGQPSQVKPAQFVHGLGITTHVSAAPRNTQPVAVPSFGDRVRRMAKRAGGKENEPDPAAGAFTSSRPGWRGASGRTALVDPVHDMPEVAPLRIPDRNTRRVVSNTSASSPKTGLFGMVKRGQTPPVSPPGSETVTGSAPRETVRRVVPSSQQSPSVTTPQPQTPQSYPNSPLSPVGEDAPSMAAKELARRALPNIIVPSPTSPTSPKPNSSPHDNPAMIRRKPPPAHANHLHHESVSSVYSQQPEAPPAPPPHNPGATFIPSNEPWVQPGSRFSVTTYATSTANTPRESLDDFNHRDRPPMPAFPPGFTESPKVAQQESVMERTRPNLDGPESPQMHSSSEPHSPVVISLKDQFITRQFGQDRESQAARDRQAAAIGISPAVARARAAAAAATEASNDRSERPLSTASSINKMLPPAPPETTAGEARDRVGMLNAQLQALSNRKINITRSIKQMTEMMPTDNLMDSVEVIRKREMEKRKVEALRQELAEVQREEYELGLKLHRAYKRLDKEAVYEPTTLWVRRVTG